MLEDEFVTRVTLLRRIKNPTDQASWQEFVRCYAPLLQRWAGRMGLQPTDMDEAVSRLLVQLYKYLPNFEYDPDRGRFRGYLTRSLQNVVAEMARECQPERTMEDTHGEFLMSIQTSPDAAQDLLTELAGEERFYHWREAKRRAQARCECEHVWLAWALTREQEIPAQQAASQLNIKIATLYMYVSRVNEYIRQEFEKLDA